MSMLGTSASPPSDRAHRRRLLVALCAAAVVPALPAYAQTGPETGAEADLSTEIVVTARRRDESLQTTPVAVTAYNTALIGTRSITNLQDIGRQTPNLQISAGRSSNSIGFIFIRGIGQADDNPSADPGVAQYVDDVYLGRLQGALLNINDVRSIEVLRGPQGTLYGKNTIGGAIKFTSKVPGDELEAYASAGYGNYDAYRFAGSLSLPLVTGKLAARVSAEYVRNDGFMRNLFDGSRTNNTDRLSGRFMLRATPTETVELLLSIDGSRDRSDPYHGFLTATAPTAINGLLNRFIGPVNSFVKPVGGDIWRGSYDAQFDPALAEFAPPKEDIWGASFRATIGDEDLSLKSISAYREINRKRVIDADASPFVIENFADHLEQWQVSQEFQLAGQFADGAVKWLGGLFYYQEHVDQVTNGNFFPGLIAVNPALDQTVRQSLGLKTKSYAAFGNVSWDINDRLSVTAGARYTKEKKHITVSSRRLTTGLLFFGPLSNNDTFNDFSPKFEVDYKFTPTLFGYASVSKGFKSGGFNGRAGPFGTLDPYLPERAWAYEAGIKSQWFDKRLTLNLAAFYTDYSDIQLQVMTVQNGNLFQLTTNAGKSHIQGLEAELTARPTGWLTLYASGGITDAKYDRYFDAVKGDVSFRKFAYTPKYNGMIGATVDAPLRDGVKGLFDINYSRRSLTYYDPQNTPSIAQPAYGLLNARAAIKLERPDVELAFFGKNLTDRHYIQSGVSFLDSFGLALAYAGAPRTYGIELNWHY